MIEADVLIADLEGLPEDREEKTWDIDVLPEDSVSGLPAVRFTICYYDPEDMNRVTRQYRKGNRVVVELSPSQMEKVRVATIPRFVRGWSGMTWPNFARMSEWAHKRPGGRDKFLRKVGDKTVDTEIPFNEDFLNLVATRMNHEYFNFISNSAMDINEAGLETFRKGMEKKGSNSSADTSAVG